MLAVTILGNNSAIPAHGRHPTAQVITTSDDLLLFDCGEGTQIQILNMKIRRNRINHIFISHLHGDHYFGLIGLISSFALLSRIQPLHVYGPAALEEIIHLQLRMADTKLPFPFTFHPITHDGMILETNHYTVECFSTKHRIECRGFLVREKKHTRKINIDKVRAFNIPVTFYNQLQRGEDYVLEDGTIIQNTEVTFATTKPRSYAFTADTIYDEELIPVVKDVNLLYHEATYPHALEEKAKERFHSTSKQAARIAAKAGVKKLLIGHFSAKFEDLSEFESEAKEEFTDAELAREGVTYLI
ncbi:MAG TPA: ribonuclease Z [Lacibacter sp.]|nr:ribonuclease Z [Lacibacter sp.]